MAHKLANSKVIHIESENLIEIIGEEDNNFSKTIETNIKMELPKNINLSLHILGGDINLNEIIGKSRIDNLGGDISINKYSTLFEVNE